MVEKVADEAIGVALMEGKGGVGTGAKDAGGEIVGEGGDIGFVGGGELNEAGEVGR